MYALDSLKADPTGTIHQAFAKLESSPPKYRPQAHAALLAALRDREHFYLQLSDNQTPQALDDAEQARWNVCFTVPQQKSQALFTKSQQLITTWASSHQALRRALLQSGKVTRQDLVAQAQDVQKLITDLQTAKEAAAKATKEAAGKVAKAAADKKAALIVVANATK